MSDIFISYARSTEREARKIGEALRAAGYSVWRDDEIPAHRSFAEVIEERLQASKAVVVLWSVEAVKSEWVQSEADRARADGKLIQLTLDGAKLPMPFDRIQCADLAGWSGDPAHPGWSRVAASVDELVGAKATPPAQAPSPRALSICVLPFANISGEPEQEYFSDGISEDIITDLSKVSALSVTARNTAFTFKGKSVDVTQIARQLGVSHVLEGSVRKAGSRVRITAQLIDGTVGDHLWAERWDRDLTDVFALQDEISQAVVAALKIRLLPEEKAAIETRGTKSPKAYNLYLMAREYLVSGNIGDPRREEAMIGLCRKATEIDPDYAQAWGLLGWAQAALAIDRQREGDTGLAAAERAEALDPGLGGPHAVKAKLLHNSGQVAEAHAQIELALSLEPDSLEVNWPASQIYYNDCRFEDAARLFEQAALFNETNAGATGMLISCYLALGDQEAARAAARRTLERVERALAADRTSGFVLAFGVQALLVLGETDRANDWIERALIIDPDNMLMRYNLACALCGLAQDTEGALQLLGPFLAIANRRWVRATSTDPDLALLRDDPRFRAMLAEAQARIAGSDSVSPPDP